MTNTNDNLLAPSRMIAKNVMAKAGDPRLWRLTTFGWEPDPEPGNSRKGQLIKRQSTDGWEQLRSLQQEVGSLRGAKTHRRGEWMDAGDLFKQRYAITSPEDMREAVLYRRNPLAFWLDPLRWDGKDPKKDMIWESAKK